LIHDKVGAGQLTHKLDKNIDVHIVKINRYKLIRTFRTFGSRLSLLSDAGFDRVKLKRQQCRQSCDNRYQIPSGIFFHCIPTVVLEVV